MKKAFTIILLAAILGLAWYLFVKPYDYRVSFHVKTSPGTAHEEVLNFAGLNINLKNTGSVSFDRVSQTLKLKDSIIDLEWNMESVNDSLTKIIVDLTDQDHSLSNRFQVPFSGSAIEKIAKGMLIPFKQAFDQKLSGFKVTIEGPAESEEVFCACIPLQSTQQTKAYSMMANNFIVDDFLDKNGMKLTGYPFLKINRWILDKKAIEFDFCFPTEKRDSLPESDEVQFKTIPKQKAIKAIYQGNYKSSDKAWYALYNYAKRNNLNVKLQPREIFLNNPNGGGDDKSWKAEVYLPLNE